MLDAGGKPLEIARSLQLTEALVLRRREERQRAFRTERQRIKRAVAAVDRVKNMRPDESFVVAMLRLAVDGGYLAERLELPQLVNARFEYQVGPGRIDLVLESLGSIYTLVEAKNIESIRDVAMALGQSFVYEVLFRQKLAQHGIAPLAVHRLIACQNLEGPLRETVLAACAAARVGLMFVGEFDAITEKAREAIGSA